MRGAAGRTGKTIVRSAGQGPFVAAIHAAHAVKASMNLENVRVRKAGALKQSINVLRDDADAFRPSFFPRRDAAVGVVGHALKSLLPPLGQMSQGLRARAWPIVKIHCGMGLRAERPSPRRASVNAKARRSREPRATKNNDSPLGRAAAGQKRLSRPNWGKQGFEEHR